jgi:sugar lactone lactonase YvrE
MKMNIPFRGTRILLGCAAIVVGSWLVAVKATLLAPSESGHAPAYTFVTMASPGEPVTNTLASSPRPRGLAVDGQGNVFFTDMRHQVICKIAAEGSFTIIAGEWDAIGSADGQGAAARFNHPQGIALDPDGNLYVADTGNDTIRCITTNGMVSTLAGMAGVVGAVDGTGSGARFNYPCDLTVDASGMIYVADFYNYLIRKVTPGGLVTTFAGQAGESAVVDGRGKRAQFEAPASIAVDASGNVFVADMPQNCIRKITPTGEVTTFAGKAGYPGGDADGAGQAARFKHPTGLAVDAAGNVYVADLGNRSIRRVAPDGVVTTQAGFSGEPDDIEGTAKSGYPFRIALDTTGNLYLSDTKYPGVREGVPVPDGNMPLTLVMPQADALHLQNNETLQK